MRQQLQHIKQENHDLEKELRSNANAEQKARLLEAKVAGNLGSIDQLRQERSLLAADHKELQRRYAKATEVCFHLSIHVINALMTNYRRSIASRASLLFLKLRTTIAVTN